MTITPEERARLREVCDAASPAPWNPERVEENDGGITYEVRAGDATWLFTVAEDEERPGQNRKDAAFIADARDELPRLLDEVEQLEGILGAIAQPGDAAVFLARENVLKEKRIREMRDALRAYNPCHRLLPLPEDHE